LSADAGVVHLDRRVRGRPIERRGCGRSLAYGVTLLVAAVTIAVLKNILSGH
jgi:hypothetical protein